jgi:peptidoglycan/xylan/chitin deacetylase (PgdA/CDA1 family)
VDQKGVPTMTRGDRSIWLDEFREFSRYFPLRALGWWAAGLSHLGPRRASSGVGMLTYHRVVGSVPGLPRPKYNVTPARLRQQLAGMLDRGVRFWPLRQVLDHVCRGLALPRRTAVVTFDDGYESVYRNAWPILRELRIPATIFLATAFLDTQQPFPFDSWGTQFSGSAPPESFRPLSVDQCREMIEDGQIEVGSHAHTHLDFRRQPSLFRRDLELSLERLRFHFGLHQATFAFPFGCPLRGFAGEDLIRMAREAGVLCALSAENASLNARRDPFHWGRFSAFPWETGLTLSAKIDGWYDWVSDWKRTVWRCLPRRRRASFDAATQLSAVREGSG